MEADIIEMWVDLEQHIPKLIQQSQKHHQEECILQWKTAAIFRDRCIGCQSRGKSFEIEGWSTVPKEWSTQQKVLWPTVFPSKSLISVDTCYSNIERGVLGIFHWLEKYHHYCFAYKISLITGHKLLVALMKEDVVSLSHRLQRTLLRRYQ